MPAQTSEYLSQSTAEQVGKTSHEASDLPLRKPRICENDAATKMAPKSVRGLKGQSRSQAEDLILSGWQGSDEDEDVNIDSSDDEMVFPCQKRRSTSSPLLGSSAPTAEENSGPLKASGTDSLPSGRDRPHFEKSVPGLGGGSVMKVKSSDARRFRKELTAHKSGAKMAVIPLHSSNEPVTSALLANHGNDGKRDAVVEDVKDEEISLGELFHTGNKGRFVEEKQSKSAGSGDEVDKGQLSSMTELRKKKGRETKTTGDSDDEARKKRRYRELEQAQRIADRRLTLRERPDSRQRDGGSRGEASTQGISVGRRLRVAGRNSPQGMDTMVRFRSSNDLFPVALDLMEFSNADTLQQSYKRAKRFENDAGNGEKVFERRTTRSTDKLRGGNSPAKQAAGVSATESKDENLAQGEYPNVEGTRGEDGNVQRTPLLVPFSLAVGLSEERSTNLGRKGDGSCLSGTETVDEAVDNASRNVAVKQNLLKHLDLPDPHGNSADVPLEVKKAGTEEKENDLFCKESLDQSVGRALDDCVDVPEERKPSCQDTTTKEEKKASCLTADDGNLNIIKQSIQGYVAVNTEVERKPQKDESEESRRKTINSADCTELGASEAEETRSCSESQGSGNNVADRESRCSRDRGEAACDFSAEGAARPTAVDAESDMKAIQETGDHLTGSKFDADGPELAEKVDHCDARREGNEECSVEQVCDTSLSNERSDRSMAGEVALHDQSKDAIATCDRTIEDADYDQSEEASEVDDHNSFCEACLLGGMLLCCDASGCKVTYHLECADPSMTEVPKGKWYCPSCTQKRLSFGVHASLKAVDSIWDVRECICPSCSGSVGITHGQRKGDTWECDKVVNEPEDRTCVVLGLTVKDQQRAPGMVEEPPGSSRGISQRVTRRKHMELEGRRQLEKRQTDAVTSTESTTSLMAQSADGLCKSCEKQYYVKWKNLSHLHNAWVSESEVKKAAPKMLESFKKRLETETLNQGRTKWQRVWQVPQRFLARKLNASPRRQGGRRGRDMGTDAGPEETLEWFVKWQDLGYEYCTWEQVQSGLLDTEISSRLASNYHRWCEGARRRSQPARIEEVSMLRESEFKVLGDKPDWLQGCKLSIHQLEELNGLRERWHYHRSTLMVDEGDQERTTTAVAFLLSLIEEYGAFKPILVIVPGTGCQVWESELQRCAEHVNTVVYVGTSAGRSAIQRYELNPSEKPIKFQIVLTTFEIAVSDHGHLERFEWEAVILDEGHRSRLTKSYRHLQFLAPYRLILLSDFSKCNIWELHQFLVYLEPGYQSLESELQKQLGEFDEDSQLTFLRGKLSEKMVGDSSPHKATPLGFREHWIAGDMTSIQVHLYCTELTKHYNLLHSGRMRADQNSISIIGLIGTLRNVCNHPFLIDRTLEEDLKSILKSPQSLVEAAIQQCGKFKTLQLMVSHFHAKGRRVLLICQTETLCYYFDDYMMQIFGPDSFECVAKSSEAVKIQAIQRFNAEDSTRFVFILKKNTAGVSFQLRDTDAVIVYDSDWNPANDIQYLEKVIYKAQGQLTIYRLYTPWSVEEAAIVYSRQRRLDLQSGIRVLTAKYCQQIIKWKVRELLQLYDIRVRGDSEKELMAEILEDSPETLPDTVVKIILDGDGEYEEPQSFKEEMPEEDGESLKEFWSSVLRDRYAGLQIDELTNAGKGLRSRKRVHYSEDALALASYAAGNEEEVKRRRKKSQGPELVQRGSPRANAVLSSVKSSAPTLVDSSSADEVLPASTVTKEVKNLDVVSQATVEVTGVTVAGKTTTGAELSGQGVDERPQPQGPILQRGDPDQPLASGKIPTKSAGGMSSTSNEEGRKTRSEQQQIMLGLWRPDVAKLCKTLDFSEKVATYADQLLVYCMKSYRMPKEPKDLVLQVQIALCVVAAERFHQQVDHLATISRVEEAMDVKLKRETWSDNYEKFVSCCKGYPLPEPPDSTLNDQAQPVAVVSDISSKSKSQRPEASSENPKNPQTQQDVDKQPVLQTPECRSTGNPDNDPNILSDQRDRLPETTATDSHADQREPGKKGKELETREEPDVPSTVSAQIEGISAVSEPALQDTLGNPVIEEKLQSTSSKSSKEQILAKLKVERREISSVVVYQQTQEMNEFYRLKNVEKENMSRRHEQITANLMRTVTDPGERAVRVERQRDTHQERVKTHDLGSKEQRELVVKRQREICDELNSVHRELLRQADGGSSRSLYDEAQGILAKVGVKSVAEAQSILRILDEEAMRKKAPVAVSQDPLGQVWNHTGGTVAQTPPPITPESNLTPSIQVASLPQTVSQAGGQTEAQPQARQLSQVVPSEPPLLSETEPSRAPQLPPPPLSQLQQSAPLTSQMSQLTHSRSSPQPVRPNLSSVQAHEVPPLPPRLPRQNYVAVTENSQALHQQPVTSAHVSVTDSVTPSLPHQVGRTHILHPSGPHPPRTIQVRQLQTDQQRNSQVRRLQTSPSPRHQPVWHTSSTGQGPPAYPRLPPQSQQSSSQPSMAGSTTATPQVNAGPTLKNVGHFAQPTVTFLPAIPAHMMGTDPIFQEELRLKKEKENIRAAYEKKAGEIGKKFSEEAEDAQKKFDALMAELKRKFDGLLDENAQLCHRQTIAVHENHVKAHLSRRLAEALRNRTMFDVASQSRGTPQQGDEPASAGGQVRNVQSGTAYPVQTGRAHVQPAQQNAFRHVAALNNEALINSGSGHFVSAAAGRVLMQPFNHNSSSLGRTSAAPQREGSARSSQGIPSPVVPVPPAFPAGGLVLQHTQQRNLVPTEDAQGQRTELAFGGVQLSNNQSTWARPAVPPGVVRAPDPPVDSSFPGSGYPGSPSMVATAPGMEPVSGTLVVSGRGNEVGGAVVGGLWQSRLPNSSSRPGSWQNGVTLVGSSSAPTLPQACTTVSQQLGRNTGETTWNRAVTGSVGLSVSTTIPSSGSVQPASDSAHRQLLTGTQNQGNGTVNPTTSHQRRSWTLEGLGNLTPVSRTSRMENQSSVVHLEGFALPMPESCGVDWRNVSVPAPTPHPTTSMTASREPSVGDGGMLADDISEGLADPSSVQLNASGCDVPIIYLSDDD